jgi:nicotinamide mononucleotide transporter
MQIFEITAIAVTLLCIILAVKEKIWTFPFGIVGTLMYFYIFFQQRVYSSMTLQAVFLAFNIYGLYKWTHPDKNEAKADNTLAVSSLTNRQRILTVVIIAVLVLALGFVMSNLNNWLPKIFPEPAKYVWIDTFILSASLAGQYLMAVKKWENWVLWLVVDILATPFYFITVGWATGLLYLVFVFTAVSGIIEWRKSLRQNNDTSAKTI